MADNAAQSIKELQERLVSADKTIGEMLQRLGKYESWVSLIFKDIAQNAKVSIDEIGDYLTKKMRRENLKQSESLMKDILGIEDAKKEVEKVPTMFERVIAQINQRAEQQKGTFAKRLFDAEEAEKEIKEIALTYAKSLGKLKTQTSTQSFLTEFGRENSVNQILLKGNVSKIAQDALQRYQDALQRVIQVQEQLNQSQRKFVSNISAVDGVTRRYNDNEQALAKLQQRWEELNVKKQAGLVNQKDFDTQTQKILDEYDRLIAKRKEFEIGDLGQMSYQRKSEREQEEERLAQLRKSNTQARLDDEMRAEKMIKQARAERAKKEAEADANMKKAVSQQVTSYKQLSALLKQYNSLKQVKGRTQEEEAALERTRQKIKEIIAEMRKLDSEQKGSLGKARDITEYDRILAKDKEITNEKKKQNDLTKQQKANLNSLLPTLQRLASAFGVAFSVRGLAQFGKKLIETRGEFEMQFVAMKQIIGDVDAATKIWNQTMQQALQSPFKAMQLVTYTKQLAAYRIETEKLFDTTKRLADISAGLGVDMGRLILAFGQVKSANFLRASEVRQFTEAGVNIVGNLAQYFTELEGRAVSTADVMERITKRMVMFSDVEEIFRRMTDEGGEFYKMQEVQANTVKGQIAKLHDAYDQMLNTIGQANQGTLRKYIESLNELVRNWRTVASFIMKNVNAMVVLVPLIATYRKGAKMAAGETFTWSRAMKQLELELAFGRAGIKKFSLSTALGTAAVYTFKGAVELTKMALRTFVPFIAIEGLMWLVTKMGEADRNAKELAKSLDEVGSKNAASLQENIDGFTDLVERLKQANEGSQDYLDIRNKIQSQYGEYLDNLELEQITVENLAKSYDKVVERMREKSRQHIMEEGLQEIADAYGDALVKFQKELKGTKLPNGMKVNDKEAADIAKKMYDLYSKDEFYRSDGSAGILLGKTLRDYYGISGELNLSLKTAKDFQKAIESRYKSQIDLETKANALTKATSDTHKEYLDQLNAEEEHEKKIAEILADASIKSSGRRELAIQAEQLRYEEKKLELQAQYQKKSDEWLKNEKAKLKENYGAFLNAYNEQVKAYVGGRFGEGWMQGDNSDAWKAYNFMIANQDRLSQGQTKWEEKILNDKKLTEENIKRIKEQQSTQTAADSEAAKALNESLKQEEDRLELIKKQMELLGLHEKQKGGSGSANNSIYGERIRLLQDMLQKYKQLAKEAYGYAKAEGKVSESFEDAWNSIMPVGYGDLEVPTSYKALAEMLQRLEAFTPSFDKNGQLSKMLADLKKAVSDALSQVDIELSVRIREDFGKQMEDMFNNYELTLELDKLNISSEAAKDLFPEFDSQTLGELQDAMQEFYEKQGASFDEEDLKAYKQWSDKIDAEILKSRKEKAKEYSKYLEKEYSERAKVEMQYAKDVAFVTANFNGEQQKNILKGIEDKYQKDINELTWKSFKESAFYVEMMDDLSSVPADYMKIMLDKIEELLAHPETLSPRALKEAINARQKILEAQMDINSISVMRESLKEMRDAATDVGGKTWAQTKKRLDEEQTAQAEKLKGLEEEIRCYEELQGQLKGLEQHDEAVATANRALPEDVISMLENTDVDTLIGQYSDELDSLSVSENAAISAEKDTNAEIQARIEYLQRIIPLLVDYRTALNERAAYQATDAGENALFARNGGETSSSVGETINEYKKEADDVSNRLSVLKKWQKAFKNFSDGMAKWDGAVADAITKIGAMGDAFYDTFDALGGETNVFTEGWKEFGDTMVQTITQALTLIPQLVAGFIAAGTSINAAMGLIGLIAEAVQLILVAVGAVAKLHDARYEREIEIQQKKIDNLQRAYDRLEKSIEKTFDTVSYMREYNQEVQNLNEQYEALAKQIDAEKAKKNVDEDKLQDYADKQQEIIDNLEEIKQQQIDTFGGIGEDNYRSAAEGFVDAWKSAFLETGDGLQGLQDHFDEFLNDWFVKQATMRIAANNLALLFQKIDQAVGQYGDGGANVTWQELQEINDLKDLLLEQTNEQLKELAGVFGLGGEGSLSGLAAGIQGMTEEQANILEAYWNSVRGYTASIDMNVSRIAQILGSGGDSTNPQLQQLTLIAANTQATHQLLQSVTKSGHSQGGYGIKVFAD